MIQTSHKRIWLYCHDHKEAEWAIRHVAINRNYLVGISCQTGSNSIFPHSGLTPAMQAAIRGELDLLMVTDLELLRKDIVGVEEILKTFADYNVSVKSLRN